MLVASGLSEAESFDIETKLISFAGFKKSGGMLVNTSYGGEGSSGCNQPKTPEHRQAISKARKGRPLTKKHREALSKAKKGIIRIPKEVREKISKSLKGRAHTKEHNNNVSLALKGKYCRGMGKIDV